MKHITLTRKQDGLTLIEILIAITIIVIFVGVVVPRVMDKPDQARVARAKQDIRAIETALDLYKLDNYVYPTTDQHGRFPAHPVIVRFSVMAAR